MFKYFLNFFLLWNYSWIYQGINDNLNPNNFKPNKISMMSETGNINKLLLAMDNNYDTDYLFDIHIKLINTALIQNISVKIYPTNVNNNHVYLIDHLKEYYGSIPSNIKIYDNYRVDSIWIRDYGPIIYNNTIIDFNYFQRRPRDDIMNYHYAINNHINLKHFNLLVEGGNILSNGEGICIISDIILEWNFEELELYDRVEKIRSEFNKFGCFYTIIMPSLYDDRTGHVDMWISWVNSKILMVGLYTYKQHPLNNKVILNALNELDRLSKNLFTIEILPMPNCKKCTYMNQVHIGNYIVVPIYSDEDNELIISKIKKITGKNIIEIYADNLIKWNGVIHCITKTL